MKIRTIWNCVSIIVIFFLFFYFKIYFFAILFITIHELSHLVTALIFKIKFKKVTYSILGMKLKLDSIEEIKYWKKLVIILSGPILNLILAFFFLYSPNILKYQQEMFYINIVLFVCNMLPIYPLDGGSFLYEILKRKRGKQNALNKINMISNITLILLTLIYSIAIIYFKNIFILLFIIYLSIVRIKQNRELKVRNQMIKSIQNYQINNSI